MPRRKARAKPVIKAAKSSGSYILILLFAVSIIFALYLSTRYNPSAGRVQVSADNDPFLGDENAPVTMIMFGAYECGYTRSFWSETFPLLKEKYIDTGKVRFVFRDMPLGEHGTNAELAAACANEQGAFWEYNEVLFDTVYLDMDSLKQYAADLELDEEQFNECLDSGKYHSEIDADRAAGIAAGVRGTPTFFVNGQKVEGDEGFEFFAGLIGKELAK